MIKEIQVRTASLDYQTPLEQISGAYTQGRVGAVQDVNGLLIETYWQVERLFVQKYQLYLLNRDALRRELELSLREAEQ